MRILVATNLLPRPDQPTRGMYNAQTFSQLAGMVDVDILGLVPEWRPWRGSAIRRWTCPHHKLESVTRYAPVLYVPVVGRSMSGALYERSLAAEAEAFRGSDAVFSSWLYPDGVAATRMAARAGKPSWMMALGSDTFHLRHPRRRPQIVAAAERCEGIVCVCQLLADRLAEAGVDRAKLHVVPNGVDTDRFRYRAKDDAMDTLRRKGCGELVERAAAGSPLILFVGNLVPVKGPDRLLTAFEQFSAVSDARLLFIGDGPMQPQLDARARQSGLAERVIFAGARPHGEVPLWMNMADRLCLSSRSEGMPNVVIESLASGLPVVGADVGACAEMVAGEPLARIVDWADAGVAAASLGARQPDAGERREMAARHGQYSWRDQAGRIATLLGRVSTADGSAGAS